MGLGCRNPWPGSARLYARISRRAEQPPATAICSGSKGVCRFRALCMNQAKTCGFELPKIKNNLTCDNVFFHGHTGRVKIGDLGAVIISATGGPIIQVILEKIMIRNNE
jgi:hypothetical protein